MATTDKRIDAYIAKAQPFAQPILKHLRKLVHQACPDVEETIKWSFPNFSYQGALMCSMAAFKAHCAFSFWKASLMNEPMLLENARNETAMGNLGRISSLADLPSDKKMISYIRKAMKLNEEGITVKRPRPAADRVLEVPEYFEKAVKKNKKAWTNFEKGSYSHRKEYVTWIAEAKTEATRSKRLAQAIEWLAEGKGRNWKYER